MNQLPTDALDLVLLFHQEGARFLLVGAHALGAHGVPRYTGDVDLWVEPTPRNADRVWRALVAFGAPLGAHGVTVQDLCQPGTVYQLGLPPRRIDVLTSISGVSFAEAWAERHTVTSHGQELPVLGVATLVKNKLSTGRTKDLLDVELLREADLWPRG